MDNPEDPNDVAKRKQSAIDIIRQAREVLGDLDASLATLEVVIGPEHDDEQHS